MDCEIAEVASLCFFDYLGETGELRKLEPGLYVWTGNIQHDLIMPEALEHDITYHGEIRVAVPGDGTHFMLFHDEPRTEEEDRSDA